MINEEAKQQIAKLTEIMTKVYEFRGFSQEIAKNAAADHARWFMGTCKNQMQHFAQLIAEEIEDCEKGLSREMAAA